MEIPKYSMTVWIAKVGYKFVSPGIFVNEIDNSQPPGLPAAIGPVIIGRFERGPALRPVQVATFAQFVEQ